MMIEEKRESGKLMGKAAFEAGRPCTPALDPAVMPALKGLHVKETLALLDGWHTGWALANLR